jgi:hypothetical protein
MLGRIGRRELRYHIDLANSSPNKTPAEFEATSTVI